MSQPMGGHVPNPGDLRLGLPLAELPQLPRDPALRVDVLGFLSEIGGTLPQFSGLCVPPGIGGRCQARSRILDVALIEAIRADGDLFTHARRTDYAAWIRAQAAQIEQERTRLS
jgi:hypothetical protein